MNQLTPKVQFALLAADFDAAIDRDGAPGFVRIQDFTKVEVAAAGHLVVITTHSRGMVSGHHLNAGELEAHTEEALTLMFQTIVRFA